MFAACRPADLIREKLLRGLLFRRADSEAKTPTYSLTFLSS